MLQVGLGLKEKKKKLKTSFSLLRFPNITVTVSFKERMF
jgi:hypothetical protein